jgi:hypothetical protein
MGIFWGVLLVGVLIGLSSSMAQAKALRLAKEAYEAALSALSANPNSNDARVAALDAGRHYAGLARKKVGSNGVALFDEVAMQNDITARLGSASLSTSTAPTDRVAKLTELSGLRDKGVLTPEEFEAEKRRLLASS